MHRSGTGEAVGAAYQRWPGGPHLRPEYRMTYLFSSCSKGQMPAANIEASTLGVTAVGPLSPLPGRRHSS